MKVLAAVVAGAFVLCTAPCRAQEPAGAVAPTQRLQALLAEANDRRSIECRGKVRCSRMLQAAQRYARDRSDRPVAGDGDAELRCRAMSLTVAVYPMATDISAATLSIDAECAGLADPGGAAFLVCARKVVDAYEGFRAFMATALDWPG